MGGMIDGVSWTSRLPNGSVMRTVLYQLVKEQYAAHWNIRRDCANLSTVDTTKETNIDTKAPRVLGPADKKNSHS